MASACTAGLDTGFIELGYAKVAVPASSKASTELCQSRRRRIMRIVPALLGWRDPGSAFSAAIWQAAALGGRHQLLLERRARTDFESSIPCRRAARLQDWNFRSALWIVLATIPIVVLGVPLSPLLNACNTPLQPACHRHFDDHARGDICDRRILLVTTRAVSTSSTSQGRVDRRHRAMRRAHSRRVALGLDADRRHVPRPEP